MLKTLVGTILFLVGKDKHHFYEIPLPGNVLKVGKSQTEKQENTTRHNTISDDTVEAARPISRPTRA